MPTTQETVATYLAAWCEPDASKRAALIEQCWADEALYCDPIAEGHGRDALDGFIAGMHAQQPGAKIVLTSGVEQHHTQIRFAWAFEDKDGKRAIEGIDIGELADDGRLSRIVGFWGAPPAS